MREIESIRREIEQGTVSLGIELGSTRIKAILIDHTARPIAQGSHDWENHLENDVWTYHMSEVEAGLQRCYAALREDVRVRYGVALRQLGGLGISAMMHGYLALDADGELLTGFRTWRNTMTAEASERLSELFDYPIPQRWSIAHLYQAMLRREAHLPRLHFLTTLAGYVHWRLCGERVLGVGDASGMFPIDTETCDYDAAMAERFDALVAQDGYDWRLREVLPRVLCAGEAAGSLSEAGAAWLDVSGELAAGCRLCPPEGDAGTGMTATNSVAAYTGNVSAGTSVFAMVVLNQKLSRRYPQIDLVTTPTGRLVAMVHCNNCTTELNAWVQLFGAFAQALGSEKDSGALYELLYKKALEGAPDCGGLLVCPYHSGEHGTGFDSGRPLFARRPDSEFTLANFMRAQLSAALTTLKFGMDLLLKNEGVRLDVLMGHGGLFKTPVVGQRLMAAAVNVPVAVMQTAGEGGAWGIAVLAEYARVLAAGEREGFSLERYLNETVFAGATGESMQPLPEDVEGFERFAKNFEHTLELERKATELL